MSRSRRVMELTALARPPARAQEIVDALAAKLSQGEYAAGSWLPSERELSRAYGVDRSTIRRATRELASQGLLTLVTGSGARVPAEPGVRRDPTDLTKQTGDWRGFHVSATRSGREPFTDTTVADVEATGDVARWIGTPVGTRLLERARRQGVVGEPPSQLATTWIISEIVDRLPILREVNTGPGGMYSRLYEIGITVRFEDSVSARLPTDHEIEELAVSADQPVLVFWRRGYDDADRIIEVTRRIVVPARQEVVYRYGPTTAA